MRSKKELFKSDKIINITIINIYIYIWSDLSKLINNNTFIYKSKRSNIIRDWVAAYLTMVNQSINHLTLLFNYFFNKCIHSLILKT
jgi:hypothetical protein